MLVLNAKQVQGILLIAAGLFGLAAGGLVMQITGTLLHPSAKTGPTEVAPVVPAPGAAVDIGRIVRENIFDPASRGQQLSLAPKAGKAEARTVANLRLLGTIDGGASPLALVEEAGKAAIYRVGETLPGGATLQAVERNRALLLLADGTQGELMFVASAASVRSTAAAASTSGGIRDLGGNRYQVARDEVEQARNNLNQLLKQARLEPYAVNGRTEGFVVRMIRPNTLLAKLGLRVGDVVNQVNGVELDSPEKALQIFQQLREAKRLTVNLTRGGERLVFAYEVN
jgi:general secretion pathway protein C